MKFLMKISAPPQLSNSGSSGATTSLRREVLTSSPIIQRKTQKATCAKNNFQEMVHNPKSGNSDKYDERDCYTECEEHCCVTKQEWSWVKCSVCEKLLHQNFKIFSQTCIEYGRSNHSTFLYNKTNQMHRFSSFTPA
jgi:hypothetical protein